MVISLGVVLPRWRPGEPVAGVDLAPPKASS
jgi:hypothetical protein